MGKSAHVVHFNKNGVVTARLEFNLRVGNRGGNRDGKSGGNSSGNRNGNRGDGDINGDNNGDINGGEGFIAAHSAAVRESFDSAIADAADARYQAFALTDRAYKFRPYVVTVDYEPDGKSSNKSSNLTVTITLTCGRRVISSVRDVVRVTRV